MEMVPQLGWQRRSHQGQVRPKMVQGKLAVVLYGVTKLTSIDLGTLPRLVRHRLPPGLRHLLPDGCRQEPELDAPHQRGSLSVRPHRCPRGQQEGGQVSSALDGY